MEPGSGLSWVDSHCHIHEETDPLPALARARAAGVMLLVCIGTGVDSSRLALELAGSVSRRADDPVALPRVLATAGLHPHEAKQRGADGVAGIAQLVAEASAAADRPGGGTGTAPPPTFNAIGECGLDYHYDHSPRADQRAAFGAQVELALRCGLPLVIHTREAWDDTFAILAEAGVPAVTIFHCFTGGPEEARRCLDLGAYLSFSGIVTFKSAGEVRAAAALCPLDRLLVETDAPLLAPVPYRGRPNEPAFVPLVGMAVAAARGEPPDVVASATAGAAARAFGVVAPASETSPPASGTGPPDPERRRASP